MAEATISFTAATPGPAGNSITIVTVSNGVSLPFAVSVVGVHITIQIKTDGSGTPSGFMTELFNLLVSSPAVTALVIPTFVAGTEFVPVIGGGSTSMAGGTASDQVAYVRFRWPNGRYTSNIRVQHNLVYSPFKNFSPAETTNVRQFPRPIRIEPVPCLPGTEIGIELENPAALSQGNIACMIEFRGRLRRFLKR